MDYSIKTGDPAPEITPTPVPEYYEGEWSEGEGGTILMGKMVGEVRGDHNISANQE